MTALDFAPGQAVVVYLQGPKAKVWGLLASLQSAGIVLRGLDLVVFDDWTRQEARGDERVICPVTVFYPMHRVERVEADETAGPVISLSERFAREVGQTVQQALGLEARPEDGSAPRA